MSSPSERMAAAGIQLPPVAKPLAAYVPSRRSGGLVWTSGQLPFVNGELVATGKLGDGVSTDTGRAAARVAALNAVAAAAHEAGGIDNISRVVRVVVYVASTVDHTGQPAVADGASGLLEEIVGPEDGAHVRSAVGVSVLPLDAPVEVELIVEA